MKKIDKKDIITFIIIFGITCIVFIPFLNGHYATDTYNISNIGYKEYAIKWSLKDGRVFMALIGLIANEIKMSIETFVILTLLASLVISNITVIFLNRIIKKYKEPKNGIQEITLISICYITIFNFMYLENMYFVESIVMSISILLYIISANILVEKRKKHILKSVVLTIIGIMCYQGTIGIFFSFVMLFTILKNKNNIKQIVIDIIESGIIALIAIIMNIGTVKIVENTLKMQQTRLGKITNILKNISTIIIRLPIILQETCNLFPRNMLIIFLIILTFIIIRYSYKNKEKNSFIYKYLAIIFISIASGSVVYMLTLSSFYTGRLRNSIGALIGIIFIFLYIETNIFEKKEKISILTFIVLISYIAINIANYENIMLQHRKVNNIEKAEVEIIEENIKRYEKNTQMQLKKIIKVPSKRRYKLEECDIIKNALKTNWAADGVINFYTGRKLETDIITKEKMQYYAQNQDSESYYQFIGDTLYIEVCYF